MKIFKAIYSLLFNIYLTGTFGRGGRGPAPLGRGGSTQVGNKSQNKPRPK